MPYYGVVKGHMVGVFRKIASFDKAVKDYPDAVWQRFPTREEAETYFDKHKKDNTAAAKAKAPPPKPAASVKKTDPPKKTALPEKKCTPSASVALVPVVKQNTVVSKTNATRKIQTDTPLEYHPVKREQPPKPVEPALSMFLDSIDAPDLPPLGDPELFQAVFFQGFPPGSKFMPQYGNALLKAMTMDVLSELLGKENHQAATNIFPLAISNAFYEQIVLHYELEKIATFDGAVQTEKMSKGLTHQRGDLLEAYLAAIEKDVCRNGEGYREARDWLFKVLALRLRKRGAQKCIGLSSSGTEHKSFTILPPCQGETSIVSDLEAIPFLSPGNEPVPWCTAQVAAMWRQGSSLTPAQPAPTTSPPIMLESIRSRLNNLNHFRHFLFETMRQVVLHTYQSWDMRSFWSMLSD